MGTAESQEQQEEKIEETKEAKIVDTLRAFYKTGKTLDLAWRKNALLRLKAAFKDNEKKFQDAHTADRVAPGIFPGPFITGEIDFALENIDEWTTDRKVDDTFAPIAQNIPGGELKADFKFHYEPKGVVLIMSPFNGPVMLAALPLIGALTAGNVAVIKPSDQCPASSKVFQEVIDDAMPECVRVVTGGPKQAENLIDSPPDHIMFTGGGRVARLVAGRAAKHLTPCTMELGGKNPTLVFDKDPKFLQKVASAVVHQKYKFAGEFCMSFDYALVMEEAYDDFVKALKTVIEQYPEPTDPVISASHFDRLSKIVEAHDDGEKIQGAGKDESELKFPLAVLLEPKLSDPCMTEELFGPIFPVLKAKSLDWAIDFVNNMPTGKPLNAYYFDQSTEHHDKVMHSIQSGSMVFNGGPMRMFANHHAGVSGTGASGFGGCSLYSGSSFVTFSNRKLIMKGPVNGVAEFPPENWAGAGAKEKEEAPAPSQE